MAEYHNQSKLRFWCQMVLPLVYDDSLSYMELLNKVVTYLNNCIQDVGNCETNIESLLEAFVNLQDYVNEIVEDMSPEIEAKIDEMIENGDFAEIMADALNGVLAEEYDPDKSGGYLALDYVLHDGKLYACTSYTSGDWDSTKWRECTVGDELNNLMTRVYGLNAGQVAYNRSATYPDNTVGKELDNLNGAVNNEKDELNAIQNNIIIEQGGIADATGKDVDSEARLRTRGFLPPYFTIIVAHPTTYDTRVKGTYYYDENDNFVQYIERNSYRVTVDESTNPNKYKVRLSFWANDSEQAITPSDLILSNYQVTDGIQTQIDNLNSNPNIKLRSVTNSILTGSVWINEVFDHLVEYNDSPYGQIANALNILKANVTHTMLSGAGLIYDAGNGNFYDYIVTNSINLSGYDYLMTMLWYNDMLSTPIGTPTDTASDNTLAGKVISILSYLKTRYPSVKLILVGIPPVNGYIYGNNVFTGTYGNGYNIKQCDALMHTLAEKYNFIFIDFEQWFISTYYQNFTDGTNVHSKSDKVYRVMGEYLATALSGQMSSNSDYLKVIKLTSDNISGAGSGWRNMFATDVPIIDETMTVVEIMPADPTQIITIVPAWKVVKGNVQLYCSLKDAGTTFDVTLARTNKTGNNGVFHVPRFVQRSLVTSTTIGTSGAVTVNNYNSRKFSDYTMVALLLGEDGADISCCMTLPVSRFATNNFKLRMSGLGGANLDTPSGAIITYVSDTSCTVELTGSKQFNKLQILGITVE